MSRGMRTVAGVFLAGLVAVGAPGPVDDQLAALVAGVGARLADRGYSVDLDRLTIEVRDRNDVDEDLARLVAAPEDSLSAVAAFNTALRQPLLTVADIRRRTIEGRREQMVAYYIPQREAVVFLSDRLNLLTLRVLVAHELVHAHQDQRHGFAAAKATHGTTLDAAQAFACLSEGEAQLISRVVLQGDEDSGAAAVMQEFLPADVWEGGGPKVPYRAGARMLSPVLESRGPAGLREFWSQELPLTTEQTLHPDKLGVDLPTSIPMPAAGTGLEVVRKDSLGEQFLCTTFRTLGAPHHEARIAASGWDGDSLVLYRDASGHEALLWRSAWDREVDADQVATLLGNRGVKTERHGRVLDLIAAEDAGLEGRLRAALDKMVSPVPGADGVQSTADFEARFLARFAPDPLWAIPGTDLMLLIPRGWSRRENALGREFLAGPTLGEAFTPNISVSVRPAVGTWPPDLTMLRRRLEKDLRISMLEADPISEIPTVRVEARNRAPAGQHHYIVRLRHDGSDVTLTFSATRAQWKRFGTAAREALESVVPAL